MKRRNDPTEQSRIAELEQLPRIEIIKKGNSWGFPNECNPLFSHGGYAIIYKTLRSGESCLAIRNLTGSMKDEEGRSIPFNLLFVADSAENNYVLDKVAMYCREHLQEIEDVLSPAIVYDPYVNGLRADLQVIYGWVSSCPDVTPLQHSAGEVNYIMVSSEQMIDIAIKEQNLTGVPIDAILQNNGKVLRGALKFAQGVTKSVTSLASSSEKESGGMSTPCDDDDEEAEDSNSTLLTLQDDGDDSDASKRENVAVAKPAEEDTDCCGQMHIIDFFKRIFGKEPQRERIPIFTLLVPVEYVQWIILGVAIAGFLLGLLF
ncbi:MAG: hypothetical protein IJZ49_00330 [Alistipes sp.]|nr:hypothetical protein [Alistipes sp.]